MRRAVCLVLLAAVAAASAVSGASARDTGRSKLDGRWTSSWSHAELVGCDSAAQAVEDVGTHVITFANGRFDYRNLRNGDGTRGSFSVHGDVLTYISDTRYRGTLPHRPYQIKFSVFEDRLRFSELPGRDLAPCLMVELWARVP
jgi:hypothetical protein